MIKDFVKRTIRGLFYDDFEKIYNRQEDLLYAQIWHDTIRDVPWAANIRGISPGRWAVGYNYIYVMTRILNELQPLKVLDIGLGISSVLISTYMDYYTSHENAEKEKNCDCIHTVIEQNSDWCCAFEKNNILSTATRVKICQCIKEKYKEYDVYAYENFAETIGDIKYDVISIDGPWGSDRYSRTDIVNLLPNVLSEKFVIIIDDTERKGEQDLINEICHKLDSSGIEYDLGLYHGFSDCTVIAFKGGWFTTL